MDSLQQNNNVYNQEEMAVRTSPTFGEYGKVSDITKNMNVVQDYAPEKEKVEILRTNDVEALKRKYGEVYQIDVVVGDDDIKEGDKLRFIFKKPNTASFNRYMKTASKNMTTSTTTFVMDNIIDEQTEELTKQTTIYPGLSLNIGTKLLNILGLGENINFKKL